MKRYVGFIWLWDVTVDGIMFFFFPDHFHIRIISVSVSNMFRALFLDPTCLTAKCMSFLVMVFFFFLVYLFPLKVFIGSSLTHTLPHCIINVCIFAYITFFGGGNNQPPSFTSVCDFWHFPWCCVATPREQAWSCLQLDFRRNVFPPSLHHSRPYVLFLQCSLLYWGCCLWRSPLFFSTYKWNLVVPGIVLLDWTQMQTQWGWDRW